MYISARRQRKGKEERRIKCYYLTKWTIPRETWKLFLNEMNIQLILIGVLELKITLKDKAECEKKSKNTSTERIQL